MMIEIKSKEIIQMEQIKFTCAHISIEETSAHIFQHLSTVLDEGSARNPIKVDTLIG